MRKIALIFVAFSEKLNFNKNNEIIQDIKIHSQLACILMIVWNNITFWCTGSQTLLTGLNIKLLRAKFWCCLLFRLSQPWGPTSSSFSFFFFRFFADIVGQNPPNIFFWLFWSTFGSSWRGNARLTKHEVKSLFFLLFFLKIGWNLK